MGIVLVVMIAIALSITGMLAGALGTLFGLVAYRLGQGLSVAAAPTVKRSAATA
jgi:hypothetical protein